MGADAVRAVDARPSRGARGMNNHLRTLRAAHGWSQQDLAERLEVSRQSVNAIETGRYDPSLPLAFRIAELFGLPIEQVFVSPSETGDR
jgi:putative transcriptional regulator